MAASASLWHPETCAPITALRPGANSTLVAKGITPRLAPSSPHHHHSFLPRIGPVRNMAISHLLERKTTLSNRPRSQADRSSPHVGKARHQPMPIEMHAADATCLLLVFDPSISTYTSVLDHESRQAGTICFRR
jgi:hypothetical protein